MTNEELNTALYEKLFAEQQDFKGWLVKQPPEEILKHAYEYVIREDIVIEMEYHDLTDEEAKALLADKKPLQYIYNIYEDLESGHMDEIRDCIESRAKTCIAEQREVLRSLPVYIFSATFAQEHGELDEYRASFRANVECKTPLKKRLPTTTAITVLTVLVCRRSLTVLVRNVFPLYLPTQFSTRTGTVASPRKIRNGQKPNLFPTTMMHGMGKEP